MPRVTPKVTSTELAALAIIADEQMMDARDLADRIRSKGFDGTPDEKQALTILQHAAALTDLASALASARRLGNYQATLEAELRSRSKV